MSCTIFLAAGVLGMPHRLLVGSRKNLNRRRVSVPIAAIALAAIGFVMPLAMLSATDDKPAEPATSATTDLQPKHEYARALFTTWQANARTDGKIPGALIGHVAREIDNSLKQYPQQVKAPQLAAFRPRLDATHDWTQADVIKLLDDLTAISTAPVSSAQTPMEFDAMRNLKPGQPLPADLTTAAWGAPAANGLRAAWLLEPRAEQYALGTVLEPRALFHNTGKEPVVFITETWHQNDPHLARDAKGMEITVTGVFYTGVTPMATYRLDPGQYCAVLGHGIAIGAGKYEEEHSIGSVGAVIEAKEGDDVRLSHSVDTTYAGWTRPDEPKAPLELWKKTIADRVGREGPLPSAAADREQLIRRVYRDIFGESPSAEELAAFIADKTPDALATLTTRLQTKPRSVETFSGKLSTGETKFRVTAADPEFLKRPRTASDVGRYVLSDHVHLLVSQTTKAARRTNKAVIAFFSPDPKVASPHPSLAIPLPDGQLTWAAVWVRGSGELWVMQKGLVRKYDFRNPAQVKESRFEPGSIANVPAPLHEALRKVLDMPGAPVQQQEPQPPKGGAKLKPGREEKLQWGQPVNGLRAALVIRASTDEPKADDIQDLYLLVQNVSDAPVRLNDTTAAPKLRYLYIKINGAIQAGLGVKEPTLANIVLQPREVAFLLMFPPDPKDPNNSTAGAIIAEGALKDTHQTLVAYLQIERAPEGAWTGKIVTGETSGALAAGKP
ncbi:MAG: hypothetical protein JWN70_3066 [Planctomycetaceae bacterium]|nr:hypothetical protein [Planctomycetaceae bacterium]